MATNIYIGSDRYNPHLVLDNDVIISAHVKKQCDPVQIELPISTLEVVFKYTGMAQQFLPADHPDGMTSSDGQTVYCRDEAASIIDSVQYAEPVHIYHDNKPIGYMYVKSVSRTGKNEYTLVAQNKAGLMDDFRTPGLLLSSGSADLDFLLVNRIIKAVNNSDAPADVKARMRTNLQSGNFTRKVKSGFIPAGTIREVVQGLLFAHGANLEEQLVYAGTISQGLQAYITYVTVPVTMNTRGTINVDSTYTGGHVEYPEAVSEIVLSEYTLSVNPSNDNSVWELLFDNTEFGQPSDFNRIYWDGLPMSHVKLDGTILEPTSFLTEYYFTGVHKLYGKRVLASKIERTAQNPKAANGTVVSIDSYAISPLNSSSIMNRLKAFYFSERRREVHQDFVWTSELENKAYNLTDSFGTYRTGVISDLDVEISGVAKASAVFHTDWEPYNSEPFSRSVVLTGSGTWTVPAGVDAINVVLIGGGSGGSSGLKGASGKSRKRIYGSQFLEFRSGGKPGVSGSGGKIRSVIINSPAKSYKYSCGAGGAGGAACSSTTTRNPGKAGGNTTFGDYSSAYGATDDAGIENLLTKAVYGAKLGSSNGSEVIHDTCREGGDTTPYQSMPISYDYYTNKVLKTYYISATETKYKRIDISTHDGITGWCYPFTGTRGGSTARARGTLGTSPAWNSSKEVIQMGNGGNGAAPSMAGLSPLDTGFPLYGWGGGGGHGGGAGGDAGFLLADDSASAWDKYLAPGKAGTGGNGGAGGKGAPGCIIIYY